MKTYKTTGRGRKQCPSCSAIIGVRAHECECGYSFRTPRAKKKTKAETQPAEETKINFVVTTPAGRCPVALSSTDLGDVRAWTEKLKKAVAKQGMRYTIDAYKYSVRSVYSVHSKEYTQVAKHIDAILATDEKPDVGPTGCPE